MSQLEYNKLFVHDHINARELSEVYFSDASERGQLFLILETPKNKINQQPMIDQIIEALTHHFISSPQDDPELLLEEILQELNQILPELNTHKIKNWLQTLDIVVGIIHQDSVYLASIGNVGGLLIHSNQTTQILEANTDFDPSKIFTDIVSGQLDTGDALIISTNALFDYISEEKIKRIIKKYTPQAAVVQFKQLLDTVPDFVTFNSLVIKRPSGHDLDIPNEQTQISVQSDDDNDNDGIIEAQSTIQTKDHKTKHRKSTRTKLVFDKDGLKNIKIFQIFVQIWQFAKIYFNFVAKIFTTTGHYIKNAWLFIFSSQYRQDRESNILQTSQKSINKRVNWFSNLSWQKKVLLISVIAVLLIFLQSLVFLTQKQAINKQEDAYDKSIQAINNSLNEVEASLIYDDEKRAEELLLNIQDMLDSLESSSPSQEEELNTAKEQAVRMLNKVRHINYVDSPLELFDLSELNQSKQIVQKDGQFYILDQENLYILEEQSPRVLTSYPNGKTLADWPNKNQLIISGDQEYVIFNLDDQQIDSFSFTQSVGNTSVQDMSIYSNNLYVLDTIASQIFKYPERGQSFSNGVNWLQDDIDLSDANSFTLDGDMYVMFNSGQILKLRKGSRDIFNYHQPHPKLGSKAILKTFTDSDYLYIIDPDNQRVAILDKEGNIKDQYTSLKFDNLVDLAIDQEEKAIYLLNGNHLYLLAINE